VNQESLSHIANQNESLSADAVLDLVQMCQTFPYFSVPYIILSKHYSSKNDFRTENTLFQAALRTPDRAWLFDYISGKEFQQSTTNNTECPSLEIQNTILEIQNPESDSKVESLIHQEIDRQSLSKNENKNPKEIIDEKIDESTSDFSQIDQESSNLAIETATEIDLITEFTPDSLANLENEDNIISFEQVEPLEDLLNTEAELAEVAVETQIESSNFNKEINFDVEPESKFTFDETEYEKEIDAVILENEINFDKEPESMFFVPSIEPETIVETEDLEVEKTNRTWLFAPELPAENEIEPSTVSIPEPEVQNVPKLTFSAGYNIEDYFKLESTEIASAPTSSSNSKENNDFFSWLNSGLANQGPMNNPVVVAKSSLIDKFIQENPSIQRPKKEFFSPEKAMKKSEVLDLNIATETLANIYKIQGYPEKAVKVYEQLQLKFPEKLSYFASLIEKLKLEHNL